MSSLHRRSTLAPGAVSAAIAASALLVVSPTDAIAGAITEVSISDYELIADSGFVPGFGESGLTRFAQSGPGTGTLSVDQGGFLGAGLSGVMTLDVPMALNNAFLENSGQGPFTGVLSVSIPWFENEEGLLQAGATDVNVDLFGAFGIHIWVHLWHDWHISFDLAADVIAGTVGDSFDFSVLADDMTTPEVEIMQINYGELVEPGASPVVDHANAQGTFTTTVVPAPTAGALFVLAGASMCRRRR